MDIKICQDDSEFASLATEWCNHRIAKYKAKRVFLPSGSTPNPLYAKWEKDRPAFLEGLEFTQLDEIVTGPKAGTFGAYFAQALPSYKKQFIALDKQMDLPDLVLLGLGMNGHIAFHEPHVRDDFYRGFVNLDEDTCARLGVADRTRGFTFGAKCFQQARGILMLVRGKDKRQILHDVMERKQRVPASLLLDHADITILADRDALST